MNKQNTVIENILENARWAPSGDNMQTWRFEVRDDEHFVIHAFDTRDHCVYDLQGHASQLAIGVLMESIVIAASAFERRVEFILRDGLPVETPTIDVSLFYDNTVIPDRLFSFLPIRSVQRRPFKTTPLTAEQKIELEESIGGLYRVKWVEGRYAKWCAAFLMFKNGRLRLVLPEAFPTHSTVIEWGVRFSKDRIPDKAVGLDPIATRMMKWAMKSWVRVKFLNTYLAGTLLPRIELDLLPGFCCAAHFVLIAEQAPIKIDNYFDAGRAIQRFWLTATQMGLQVQPEMTPLIFSEYIEGEVRFTDDKNVYKYAKDLCARFKVFLDDGEGAVFVGRIGFGRAAYARSLRLSVSELLNR